MRRVRWTITLLLVAVSACLLVFGAVWEDVTHLAGGVWIGDTYGRLAFGRLDIVPIEWSWPRADRREWWMNSGQFMYSGDVSVRASHLAIAWLVLFVLAAGLWGQSVATVVRLRSHARKGICHWCSYSRAGLSPETPCPECGRASSAEFRAATGERT